LSAVATHVGDGTFGKTAVPGLLRTRQSQPAGTHTVNGNVHTMPNNPIARQL
jgi:hypothetical protein